MNYEEKYKKALDRAVNLFVTNNISATAACEIFPELNKSEEINYEKKYKEALERVRDLMTNQNPPAFDKYSIEIVFPELKESEDERIRRKLICFVENWKKEYNPNSSFDDYAIYTSDSGECDKILAWLEKHKED